MIDSFTSFSLDFATNPNLREEYINAHGTIRIGRLMEDLDALAGSIAYAHCTNEADPVPLTIVTASVDRIDILEAIRPNCNMRMFGFVSYVGKSSMEVSIRLEAMPSGNTEAGASSSQTTSSPSCGEGEPQLSRVPDAPSIDAFLAPGPGKAGSDNVLLIAAKFIMVARDPMTQRAARINELQLDTNMERHLFAKGAEHKAKKQFRSTMSLALSPPTVEEVHVVHELHKHVMHYTSKSVPLPPDMMWMQDTTQTCLFMTMPQDRNIHGAIFGGYLIRLAVELSYSTAVLFLRDHPILTALDDIEFHYPVPIGSLLSLTATVVYADPRSSRFQVSVQADVLSASKGTRETTNTFHFTYTTSASARGRDAVDSSSSSPPGHSPPPPPMRRVLPVTYEESMLYLQGRRRERLALEMADSTRRLDA